MPDQIDTSHDALAGEYARYMVNSRAEIAQILRAVMRQTGLVTAYFNQGKDFLLTSIVDVDADRQRLIVDCGADAETNKRALVAGKVVFVTSQDRVKIQFNVPALEEIEYQGRPAFRASLPVSLLKLQRREFYRLATPMRSPLMCVIPDFRGSRFEAVVVDISVGGVGINGFAPDSALEVGKQFATCRIALPEEGTVVSTLEVRNIQQIALRSGGTVLRAGCRFTDIPAAHQAMIQRYIIRIDRERRALVRGS